MSLRIKMFRDLMPQGFVEFNKMFEILMKISIGTNIKDGPWGGGNLFAINCNFL